MALSRLRAIAELVPVDASAVAEIGYDHGYLIELLARLRPDLRIVGVEKQSDAADRFRECHDPAHPAAGRIELINGDGLEALADSDIDVLVMAGLSERRIVAILSRSPGQVGRFRRLVLSPLHTTGELRPWLHSVGWAAVEERLVKVRRRFYQAFAAEPGAAETLHPAWQIGAGLFEPRHPLLDEFLNSLQRKYTPRMDNAPDTEGPIARLHTDVTAALRGKGL